MSSYWTGYAGAALLLSEQEFNQFIHDYTAMHDLSEKTLTDFFKENSVNEYAFITTKSLLENNSQDTFYITAIDTDCCQGMYFRPFVYQNKPNTITQRGKNNVVEHRWSDENCYAIFANKDMLSYNTFVQKPYESYETFVDEFRNKMDCYLPFDFDYDAHLGYFAYACYA